MAHRVLGHAPRRGKGAVVVGAIGGGGALVTLVVLGVAAILGKFA